MDAHLEGTDLQDAHLEGANLFGATGVSQDQLEFAIGDSATVLPEGVGRPTVWPPHRGPGA